MNTARGYMVGFGTQTAALASGGNDGSPPGKTSATEEYNGSSWSEVNNGNDQVKGGGCGTQTAGLTFGGQPGARTDTAEYDGTNWTTGGALNTGRTTIGGGGTQTAGMAMCGETPPSNRVSNYEEYNGTSWTAGSNLTIARNVFVNGVGTQTAGLMFGGTISSPPLVLGNATEQYNGTSWSSVANLATGRTKDGGTGIQTAGLSFGGQTSPGNDVTNTEEFVTGSETITASTLTTS